MESQSKKLIGKILREGDILDMLLQYMYIFFIYSYSTHLADAFI